MLCMWCFCYNSLLLYNDIYWFVDDDCDDCFVLMDCGKYDCFKLGFFDWYIVEIDMVIIF